MAEVTVDKSIGSEIKNISKPNDRGNINFEIKIHGEWIHIGDCPPKYKTNLQKMQYVEKEHLEGCRGHIFCKNVQISSFIETNTLELYNIQLKQFKEDGIEIW